MAQTTALLCKCATHECLDPVEVSKVMASLEQAQGIDLEIVGDLCGALAHQDTTMQNRLKQSNHVIACFPRAVRWLLNRTTPEPDDDERIYHNLRNHSAEEVLLKLGGSAGNAPVPPKESVSTGDQAWSPWYPVIDYDRCTHCGQCLSFCLFNVYEKDKTGKVLVGTPENCKDNCPACARICPEIAIIFPKTGGAPINGDEIQDELLEREKAQIALQQSGGADLHSFLSARNRPSTKNLLKPAARKKITGDTD